jgi:anti-sigma regulatory factor (Ser/Thr protein kinase)
MRNTLRSWLASLDLDSATEDDLILAMNEAASNAVDHAYPPAAGGNGAGNNRADNTVDITLRIEPGTVSVEITDHGSWRAPPAQPNGRGLGIPLMHRLVASVQIHYSGQGTRVRLRQPIPPARSGRPSNDHVPDSDEERLRDDVS